MTPGDLGLRLLGQERQNQSDRGREAKIVSVLALFLKLYIFIHPETQNKLAVTVESAFSGAVRLLPLAG